jgi:hypothetical protein
MAMSQAIGEVRARFNRNQWHSSFCTLPSVAGTGVRRLQRAISCSFSSSSLGAALVRPSTLCISKGGLMAKKPFKTSKINLPFGCDREVSDWGKIENRPKKPANTSRNQQKPAFGIPSVVFRDSRTPRLQPSARPSFCLQHFCIFQKGALKAKKTNKN